MKFEFSAGGIVIKRIMNHESRIMNRFEILVCQHSQHHGWVFPKGLIGDHVKGEKKEETAIREVEEETGVKAKILKSFKPVTYWYVFEKEKIKKTVYYFLMEYIEGDIDKHDMEMEDVEWLPINKVLNRLSYKSDKQVFKEALPIIENLAKT